MMTSANLSDSRLLSLYFCRLWELPYWMLFPAMVDTKLCEGLMLSRIFGLAFATLPRIERFIFGVNTLRGKLHQLGSPNLQDIFIGG